MNLKAQKFTILRCVVCGYTFSDKHHIYPKAMARHNNREIIALCPNHHRYANMTQAMIKNRVTRDLIRSFAGTYFDSDFNAKVLDSLIDWYDEIASEINAKNARTIFHYFWGDGTEEDS